MLLGCVDEEEDDVKQRMKKKIFTSIPKARI